MQSGHTVILLGTPLAGKTTLREHLVHQMDFVSFEFGALLRDLAKRKIATPHTALARATLEKGILLDDMTAEKLFNHYVRLKAEENLITDGFPRTVGAISGFKGFMQRTVRDLDKVLVIHLAIKKQTALARAGQRLRSDDQDKSALMMRMRTYEEMTLPTLWELSKDFNVLKLCGEGNVEENVRRVVRELSK